MGYTNIVLVQRTLANTLTSASPRNLSTPVDYVRIGATMDFNVVDEDTVEQFIQWADEEINSAISQLYMTPLCESSDLETELLSDINDYNDYIITDGHCPLYVGDTIVLTDGANEERHVISVIVDSGDPSVFETLDPISYNFLAANTRVLRVKFPEPVTLMSSRWSAANVYEKYFMAEASPSQSEYGKWMRSLVKADINNILNGRTILHGAHRISSRFFNPTLTGQYGLPNNKGNNDMDIPS